MTDYLIHKAHFTKLRNTKFAFSLLICCLVSISCQGQLNGTIGYGVSTLSIPDRTFDFYNYYNQALGGTELKMPQMMHGFTLGCILKDQAPIWFELHMVRRFSQSNSASYESDGVTYSEQWRRRMNTLSLGVSYGKKIRLGFSVDFGRYRFKVKTGNSETEQKAKFEKAYYLNHVLLGGSIYLGIQRKKFYIKPYYQFLGIESFLTKDGLTNYNHPASNFGVTIAYCISSDQF